MDTIAYQKKILIIMIVGLMLISISQLEGEVDPSRIKMMIKPQVKTIITGNVTVNSPSYIEDGHVVFDTSTNTYTRILTTTSIFFGRTSPAQTVRGLIRWDISHLGIPLNITTTKLVVKYHGQIKITGYDAHIHNLQLNPILTDANLVYADIGDGDVYADENGFMVVGANKQIELNNLARDKLTYEYKFSAHPYFSIGMQLDSEAVVGKYNRMYSEEYATANPKPTLYIEYQYEIPDLEPSPEESIIIFIFVLFTLFFGLNFGPFKG